MLTMSPHSHTPGQGNTGAAKVIIFRLAALRGVNRFTLGTWPLWYFLGMRGLGARGWRNQMVAAVARASKIPFRPHQIKGRDALMRTAGIFLVIFFAGFVAPGFAHDPGHPELNAWFDNLKSGRGL